MVTIRPLGHNRLYPDRGYIIQPMASPGDVAGGFFGRWSISPEVETNPANGRFFRSSFVSDNTFAINRFVIDYFREDQT